MSVSLGKNCTVNLNKCVDLSKRSAGLNKIIVGLGWDVNKNIFGSAYDLDAMSAYLSKRGLLTKGADFVYFGNKKTNGCYLTGDNLTGEGDGDDEQIIVTLKEVPAEVQAISFAVVIYDAKSRHQKFGNVENAYIRVVDADTNIELLRYDLGKKFTSEVGVVAGNLERVGSEWQFRAIGEGLKDITHSSLKEKYRMSNFTNIASSNSVSNIGVSNTTEEPLQLKKVGFFSKLFKK